MIVKRHKKILEMVDNNDILIIKEIAKKFSVSEMTIRRDISELNKLSFITLIGGRISKIIKLTYDNYYGERLKRNRVEKEKITDCALKYISNGNSIFIDGSSTCNFLVKKLHKISRLTVITNSIINLKELVTFSDLKGVIIGGIVSNELLSIGFNAVPMLFGHLLTGTAQIVAGVRTYWSPEALKRVAGYKLTDNVWVRIRTMFSGIFTNRIID